MAIYKAALASYLSNFNPDSQEKLISSLKSELLSIHAIVHDTDEVSDSTIHKIIGIFKYIHVDDAAFYEKDKNQAYFKNMLKHLLVSLNELTLSSQEASFENTL